MRLRWHRMLDRSLLYLDVDRGRVSDLLVLIQIRRLSTDFYALGFWMLFIIDDSQKFHEMYVRQVFQVYDCTVYVQGITVRRRLLANDSKNSKNNFYPSREEDVVPWKARFYSHGPQHPLLNLEGMCKGLFSQYFKEG